MSHRCPAVFLVIVELLEFLTYSSINSSSDIWFANIETES
jgi:hypothetical protein